MDTLHDVPSRSTSKPGCFAVKVRTRGELAVGNMLRRKGFDVLAPTCASARARVKPTQRADSAMFPGYIFVRFDPREVLSLVTTEGVSYIVRSGKTLEPLPLEEELTVQTLCDYPSDFQPCKEFVVGQQVAIESGPLKGRQGTLVRVNDNDRLVLSLNSIFSAVSVDLRDTIVKACD